MKPGYKQTEAGVIPEDWEARKIGQLIEFEGGSQPDKRFFSASPRPGYVRLIQIRDYKSEKFETYAPTALLRRFCNEEDIMIGRYGPPVFQILRGLTGAYNVALIKAKLGSEIDRGFAYYLLKQESLFEFIDKLSRRSSGQTGVDLVELRNYSFPLPPPFEQRVISASLSDVDALLTALDQLISKKRDLKQAAMQQLLTGQTRLPGFDGEWVVKLLGEIAQPRRERVDPRRSGGCEFCVELENLASETGMLIGSTVAGQSASLKTVFREGDVLFGKLRAYLRKYWYASRPGVCSTEIWALSATSELLNQFLFQVVQMNEFIEVASNAYGTHMPRSDWKVVRELEISLPSVAEQSAIAALLSDMDAELASLKQRREKIQALKQSMMQELLTGRTRLV